MKMSIPYDVAISYVAEDALTARHLIERLHKRLNARVFDPATFPATTGELPPTILQHDVRVVLVLHQRLWGQTPSTRLDLETITRRVASEGSEFLVVVQLEPDADVPACLLKRGTTRLRLSEDGEHEVDGIAAAVRRAGGRMEQTHPDSQHTDVSETGTPYASPQSATKAALAAQRETDAVIAEIEARIKAIPIVSRETTLRVRRSPDRCVVQAGDIGLSVSWLRPAAVIPEGTLLVIEWAGTITMPGEGVEPRFRAIAVSEDELHLEAAAPASWNGPAGWNWWSDGAPMRKYTSRDLGALCVHRLLQRVEDAAAK